jgi:hypothetical protein
MKSLVRKSGQSKRRWIVRTLQAQFCCSIPIRVHFRKFGSSTC